MTVDGKIVGAIPNGVLCLVGLTHGDTEADVDWIARKILGTKVFPGVDGAGQWKASVSQVGCRGDCRWLRRHLHTHTHMQAVRTHYTCAHRLAVASF